MLLLGCALAPAAGANGTIYGFVDEAGVERLTNLPPDDARYRPLLTDRLAPARSALSVPRGIFALPFAERPFHAQILSASQSTGVDAALLHAVISVESGYREGAVSRTGATGLMQLMPGTARRYGVSNPRDPADNIAAGARYLRDLLRLFDNNLELALAAYNAGEQAVIRFKRQIPPYGETQRYVPLVLAHYARLSAADRASPPARAGCRRACG